eukprot:6497388-Pyramimonas_sp.AAC.1
MCVCVVPGRFGFVHVHARSRAFPHATATTQLTQNCSAGWAIAEACPGSAPRDGATALLLEK